LKSFIGETVERSKDWSDILLGYRKYIAQYEEKIIMYPLDGDSLSLFYRKDILRQFNLSVPRTWDEYTHVAQQTNGQVFDNQTLVGSCVGRGCPNVYWLYLLLSQMTQTHG
jgi:multiple sugar transport system substrate-binding protein